MEPGCNIIQQSGDVNIVIDKDCLNPKPLEVFNEIVLFEFFKAKVIVRLGRQFGNLFLNRVMMALVSLVEDANSAQYEIQIWVGKAESKK